jgi:hypothetical protein
LLQSLAASRKVQALFDQIASLLPSPDHIHAAPRRCGEAEFDEIRAEAVDRASEFLRISSVRDYGIHPLGFLNIPLFASPTRRIHIHIWHRRMFSASSPYQIHDHSHSSYSIVLAGCLRNAIYDKPRGPEVAEEFNIAEASSGMTDTTLARTAGRVRLVKTTERKLTAGVAYGLPRGVFHYANAVTDFAATLYFYLWHPGAAAVSRVAVPVQAGVAAPLGRFEYGRLDDDGVRAMARSLAEELRPRVPSA